MPVLWGQQMSFKAWITIIIIIIINDIEIAPFPVCTKSTSRALHARGITWYIIGQ